MKKFLGIFLAAGLLMAFILFKVRNKPQVDPKPSTPEPHSDVNAVSSPTKQGSQAVARPAAETWMEKTLSHQLTPDFIRKQADEQGIELKEETKGHPKSGQRLELTWGSDPSTTAVFDIVGQQQYQLSAVRSLYSGGSFNEMKDMLQEKIKRPVERENAESVVFAADERGLTVWLAEQGDGRLKLAFEYGAHSHPE